MATTTQTAEALNDAAIALAKKAADNSTPSGALQFAYGAAALALAAMNTPFAGSFSHG